MKQVIEVYAGIWIIMILMWTAIAFTVINLNVAQARKTYNDVKAEIQACNGNMEAFRNANSDKYNPETGLFEYNGGSFSYTLDVSRVDNLRNYEAGNETYIYNDLFKIDLEYTYHVPLFGKQLYPQIGYVY